MSWNLQIVPKGLLLSKYLKNIIVLNPDNVKNIENNSFLADQYQTFNQSNNSVNLIFQLSLFNDDPLNTSSAPSIISINSISISNDDSFGEIYTLIPSAFSSVYNFSTDYNLDLSAYNIYNLSLPDQQSVNFTETNGNGIITIKNWTLSGSSGTKRVYVQLSVTLSDNSVVKYPNQLNVYDEIIVCSSLISSPGIPSPLGKTYDNYSGLPVYYESDISSNSGVVGLSDRAIASYFWDGLILNSSSSVYRNNYSKTNLQLFDTFKVSSSNLNQESLPIVYTNLSNPTWSPSSYNSYKTLNFCQQSSTNNIYFFECFVNNSFDNYSYVNGKNFFYEINVTNLAASTKYLRCQIIFDETFTTTTVVISVDDTTWSSDSSYVPSAIHQTYIITSPDIAGQITQSGSFLLMLELVDSSKNIYQVKLIFKPNANENNIVLAESLFTSNLLNTSTNLYGEFRNFIQNTASTIILESNQYGVCQGVLSAAVMPTDKIKTNYSEYIQNTANQYDTGQSLNTWFTISNSPAAGVVGETSSNLTFYNNFLADVDNNISAVEVQSNLPTFSEENTLFANFKIQNTSNELIKTAYSFDSNLDYSDFVFTNLLSTFAGIYLPQNNSAYEFITSINWTGTNQFGLNVRDIGAGQTCSLTTTVTDSLFLYSQSNTTGVLTPPLVVKTLGNISTSNTYQSWISTNGYSTSTIIYSSAVLKNQGTVPISINTGSGLSTISPGQPYVVSPISISSTTPTSFVVSTNTTSVTSSVNLMYDFGELGTITDLSLKIQIVTPPTCPTSLPSFQYSVEVSDNFYDWTFVSDLDATTSFDPISGNITLSFSNINEDNVRYARVRLYYNVSVTFDPRSVYRYSSLTGAQTPNSVTATQGKFIIGFTDTNAKNNSLGTLYDQPTYLRKYVTNTTSVAALVFDFSEWSSDVNGPVYINLLTESDEKRVYTINSDFQINKVYSVQFKVSRENADNAFKLRPTIIISAINFSSVFLELDEFITNPSDSQSLSFGYYPFISLVGNGNINLSYSVFKGDYNQAFNYSNDKAYFSLISAENVDYTAQYAKNILAQNSYGISSATLPVVNKYFLYNYIQKYSHDNVTFIVKAATTSPVGLFGNAYVDGIYLEYCDYVLVAGQADKTTNGVYQVQSRQWVKQNANPSSSNLSEPTILVEQGNVYENSLWMQDVVSGEWIPNLVSCPIVLSDNNLLFTGISSYYKYPQLVKLGVYSVGIASQSGLDQIQIKLLNSPNGYITDTDPSTQWVGVLQNNQLYALSEKANSNNTVFMNFAISSSQIAGIATNAFPAIYNLVVSYSNNYSPAITQNSDFILPEYGNEYRLFYNHNLIYQLFSTFDNINIGSVTTSIINTSVYGLNLSGIKSPQSGFSTDLYIDNIAPTLGTLSITQDNIKNVVLGLSTVIENGSGLALARFVQKTPSNETFYSNWFGFNTDSFVGVSSLVAYPTFVTNAQGMTTGEPLSGFYRYSLQVADNVGNISQTNAVESFYYETAIVDTQGPSASVGFVNPQSFAPISISSSTILTAKMLASDNLSQVKAYRYRILPDGDFSNWVDYNEFVDLFLPESISDGILSIQFQFKDFGNNVLYSDATISNDKIYIYTWNIVSKLIGNTLFTVTEQTTYNNNPVLLIGASKNNTATLFIWNNSKLIELQYPGFSEDQAITAMLSVDDSVIIGTNKGRIFIYKNGVIAGSFAQLIWGSTALSISKFELHQYLEDSIPFVYATTLNIPRIFRTAYNNLRSLNWEIIQTDPVYMKQINVLNSGLWSGTNVFYSISSCYVPSNITPVLNYGISSVIVSNGGSGLAVAPTITVSGPISNVGLQPVMQGSISQLVLIANGTGYTAGATVAIDPPAAGGASVQATGSAVVNSLGQVVSLILTNPGYGYTSKNPKVTITGVGGYGSKATASSVTQYDSIYSVTVTSSGVSTSSSITLSAPNGAILTPSMLYRFDSITLNTPGFGYTSAPDVVLNGMTTLASATVNYGSIQSITVTGTGVTFPISQSASAVLSGGVATNITFSLSTSAISFSTGNTSTYLGFVLNSINLTGNGYGFGTIPSISFATSSGNIYQPELEYILSDDLITFLPSGSIYDIKSFDDNLFLTSSSGDVIKLGYSSGVFNAERQVLNTTSNKYESLTPVNLAKYVDSEKENLYFSIKEEPFIGKLEKNISRYIFDSYRDNILLFKPYNFDIISNWQLKKILSTNGSAKVNRSGSGVSIQNFNSQVFYESTKENTWFNRCTTSNDYLVTFDFTATYGTQSFEITTFTSTLKVAFACSTESMKIYFGNSSYEYIEIDVSSRYIISFVKSGNDLYIYNNYELAQTVISFFSVISASPVIRFGYIFEPQELVANGQTIKVFGLPKIIQTSLFTWYNIKFSFNASTDDLAKKYYSLSLPYELPNSESIRAMRNIKGKLYAATKSLTDSRTTTVIPDLSTKVFRLENNVWNDVSGTFETYTAGINTSYVISSPNDINALGDSFFITGLVKSIQSRQGVASIFLGLNTNVIYEEQQNIFLSIVYPYNPEPAGKYLSLSVDNSFVQVPSSVYFAPGQYSNVVVLGIASTATSCSSIISATDGDITANISANILPIGISTLGLSTNVFTAYSQDLVVANLQLNSIPLTNRTITLTSDQPTILNTPNNGIVTVLGGNIGVNTTLVTGVTTSSNKNITISASYRSTNGIATVVAQPFVLTLGLNTNYFIGNEAVRKIYATASVSKSPVGILTVSYNSSNSSILSTPSSGYILPSSFSTSPLLTIGVATTANININITASIPGSIQTSSATAAPFVITSAVADYNNPVLGLQTATVTFTINTTPQNAVTITNIVTSPTLPNLVFSSLSTVAAGSLTTSFGISTSIQTAAGIAITVQGKPFGFNTSPTPGLILSTDVWRITNLNITPTSIVGGGANSNGIAQSFAITATLNVGLATTVYLSSGSAFVPVTNIRFSTTGTGSASSTGYATGLTTSLITGFAITATGPSGLSSTFSGLTLNPFLISSFTTGYIWNGSSTTNPNYTIGGIGATVQGVVTLNAYVLTGLQTVRFTDSSEVFIYGQTSSGSVLGLGTVKVGSNSTTINFGVNSVSSNISTSVTASLLSYFNGLTTQYINVRPIPTWSATFYPIYSGKTSSMSIALQSSAPINLGATVGVNTTVNLSLTINANSLGVQTSYSHQSFNFDETILSTVTLLGTTQTYNVLGYAKTGNVYGMGYNYYGELSKNYPVSGMTNGSASKVYMGAKNIVKTAAGYHHNLALDSSGNVYAIGYNIYGQLGYSGISTNIFRKVITPEAYTANIFAQNNSSFILSANNNLYGFGQNSSNCFGTSGFASTSYPYLIATSVQYTSIYGDRGTIVTYDNKLGIQSVYEFGNNATGLTIKPITQITDQGVTRAISNLIIYAVDTGESHTLLSGQWTDVSLGIVSNGVLAWGYNTNFQLGTSSPIGYVSIPNALHFYDSSNINPITQSKFIYAEKTLSGVVESYLPNNQYYVSSVVMGSLGIGYTFGATVSFSAPPTAPLAVTATGYAVTNTLGIVSSVLVSNQGSGYNLGAAVTFSPPTTTGLGTTTATATATVVANKVTAINIVNPGFGYLDAPTVYITPIAGGSGAIGIASVINSQVTNIVVTNSGYGYTSAPTVTITPNVATFGSGATAYANLATNASVSNKIYEVGVSWTANASGYAIAQTSIANPLQLDYPYLLYKFAKNQNHFVWNMQSGEVLVSGGSLGGNQSLKLYSTSYGNLTRPVVYAENINFSLPGINSTNETVGYVLSNDLSPTWVGFNSSTFAHLHTSAIKNVKQPNVSSTSTSAYEIVLMNDYTAALIYTSPLTSTPIFTDNYLSVFLGGTFIDVSIPNDLTNVPGVYMLSYSSSTNVMNLIQGFSNNTYHSIVSKSTSVAPTKIDGTWIKNFTQVGYTASNNVVCVGYADGTLELYCDQGSGHILISSWSTDGSSISCLKSIYTGWNLGAGFIYLFVATQNGKIYAYDADGGSAYTALSSTQSLPLLNSNTISPAFGYITLIEQYAYQLIIAATSNNYILVIDPISLNVVASALVSGSITSITWNTNPSSESGLSSLAGNDVIFVSTSNKSFAYILQTTPNYEIGLNYYNASGTYQQMTSNGLQTGIGFTSVFQVSTNDTYTLIVDSSGS